MNEHLKFIQNLRNLLEDCGMPDKLPDRQLLYELYFILEEHLELFE